VVSGRELETINKKNYSEEKGFLVNFVEFFANSTL